MKTEFLRATTEDKFILQGIIYRPDQPTDKGILHIHGMAGNFYENRFLDIMAKSYTDAGYAFLSGNTRGRDMIADFSLTGSELKGRRVGNAYEIFSECIYDIKAWLDCLSEFGFGLVVLQGHSLGGSKITYYQAYEKDQRVKGLILLSATDMIGYIEVQADHARRLEEANKLVAEDKGNELLNGFVWEDAFILSANTYIDFSRRGNPIDVFRAYDPEARAAISEVNVPILAIMGTKDEGILAVGGSAQASQELLKKKAAACPDFLIFLPESNHGYYGKEEEVAGAVTSWLKKWSQ